jgi:hypothetical protein
MSRPVIAVILILNAAAIVVAVVAYSLVHRDHRAIDTQELQQRVAARLAAVTDPADMQSSSAAVAKMVASGNRVVQSSVGLLDRTLAFVALVGVLNITFVLAGIWHRRKSAAKQFA